MNTYKLWVMDGESTIVFTQDGNSWLDAVNIVRWNRPREWVIYRVAEMTHYGLSLKFGPKIVSEPITDHYYGC